MNDSSAGQPDDQDNPFAAPQVDATALPSDPTIGDAERVRREYISHEVSLKSIGLLYYIVATFFGFGVLAITGASVAGAVGPRDIGGMLGTATLYGVIVAVLIVVGRGLRQLKTWIRIPVGMVSVLGLLGIPCGTIIGIYVLYLVISPKATIVLSPQYQQVIAQTPHIRYKTSAVSWIVLAVFVALLVGLIAMMVLYS